MSKRERLLIISNEPPYPLDHGGNVDRWNRLVVLREAGFRLALATWVPANSGQLELLISPKLAEIFDDVYVFHTSLGLRGLIRRLIYLPRYSPHVSSRRLSKADYENFIGAIRDFGPAAIMLDGIYGGMLALQVSKSLTIPLLLRSHNIEHIYMRRQASLARSISQRIAWRLASFHLETFEEELQRKSLWVFDISKDDLYFWRSRGINHNSWVPPFFSGKAVPVSSKSDWGTRPYDLVYLGNLYSPNNLQGLKWFVQEVLPSLRFRREKTTVLVAGSKPSEEIRALIMSVHELTLLENPENAAEVWQQGRVLINPILSGSGINIKSVEMLFFDAWLVTTSIGVQGFSSDIASEFVVANDANSFAEAVDNALQSAYSRSPQREAARRALGLEAADRFLTDLAKLL